MIIPSRKRLRAIEISANRLFPDACVLVGESERDAYASVVDSSRIVCHPDLVGYTRIFNWSQEHFKEECLVFFDDDIKDVKTNFPKPSHLKADAIRQVIENSIQVIVDLDLSVFCFSRTSNYSILDPWNKPIVPVQFPTVAFGIRGKARHRKSDEALLGRADIDWGLTTLLEDRIVYADVRYFFDNGAIFAGEGGNVGLFDDEHRKMITAKIKKKWGKYVPDGNMGFQKSMEVVALRMKVNRSNNTALR